MSGLTKESFALRFDDGSEAVAVHHRPPVPSDTGLVIVVGGPQYRVGAHRQFYHLSEIAAELGVEVLRFDFGGRGDSSGAYGSLDERAEQVRQAADAFLKRAPKIKRLYYWGLCDAASLLILHRDTLPACAGLGLANPWVRDGEELTTAGLRGHYRWQLLSLTNWKRVLTREIRLRNLIAGLWFLMLPGNRPVATDLALQMEEAFLQCRLPLLILLSEQDLTAKEFDQVVRMRPALRDRLHDIRRRTSVVRLPDADHTFASRAARDAVALETLLWISRTVSQPS